MSMGGDTTKLLSSMKVEALIDFLLEHNWNLLEPPIGGVVRIIWFLFGHYHSRPSKSNLRGTESYTEFMSYLNRVNEIDSLLLGIIYVTKGDRQCTCFHRLTWINFPSLLLIQNRLRSQRGHFLKSYIAQSPQISSNYGANELLAILDGSFHTNIFANVSDSQSIDAMFHSDQKLLEELLDKPSSQTILAKQKARLRWPPKPFTEVCLNLDHSHVLAGFCLNRRDNNNSAPLIKLSYPTNKFVRGKLAQYRSLISQDVYKCALIKTHFLPVINHHTDMQLGDCSYLDTCHKMKSCRYLHYYTLDPQPLLHQEESAHSLELLAHDYTIGDCLTEFLRKVTPAQWIKCDVRYLPLLILGKFAVIISDPAWDIHMSLPYGTCKDVELLSIPMHELQDEGIILLWVTGRSIEIGRRALSKWGYEISDELVWVKLNQLKRTIVTGRTGHWLNHSKEHLLVGVKGSPVWLNRQVDIDVIVSGTRETLRKPDEIYDIVQRIAGVHARKLEIFGRDHNTRPGWFTIGNQLTGTSIHEGEVKLRYNAYMEKQSEMPRPHIAGG